MGGTPLPRVRVRGEGPCVGREGAMGGREGREGGVCRARVGSEEGVYRVVA